MKLFHTLPAFLCCIFTLSLASAQQPPNGGFETWTNTSYGEVPQGAPGIPWTTNDSLVLIVGGNSTNKAVKKVGDAHSGSYALCIQQSYIEIPSSSYKDSGGGVIFLGYADFVLFKPVGIPYTARPVSISGYYKLTATYPDADTSRIIAAFRESGTVIGQGMQLFSTPVGSYQPFTIPITWSATQQPDKLEFSLEDCGVDKLCRDTSTRFYVDDLLFNFPNGVKEHLMTEDGVQVFPDPASDHVSIRLSPVMAKSVSSLSLHDVQGRVVHHSDAVASQRIALDALANGVYFIQLRDASGHVLYGRRIQVTH